MSIFMYPINEKSKNAIASGEVMRVAPLSFKTNLKGTVSDPELFGELKHHKEDRLKVYDDIYMRTAVKHLAIPVLNPFLAGREAKVWKLVLHEYKDVIPAITSGQVAYNLETEEFVEAKYLGSTPYDPEKWLIGGQILKHLQLDDDQLKEKFIDLLYRVYILSQYSKKALESCPDVMNLGTIKKIEAARVHEALDSGSTEFIWLIGNYVYYPEKTIVVERAFGSTSYATVELEQGTDEWDEYVTNVTEKIIEMNSTMFDEQFVDVSTMAAVIDTPDQLWDQVMDYIFILPMGYRPNIAGRVDPLTKQYNKLVQVDNELTEALRYQNQSVRYILNKYSYVVKYITNIFIGEPSLAKYCGKSYQSLAASLGGKTGLMRDKLQSCRSDFTGRTVITSDPEMPINEIGVPKKMIRKLCETGAIVKAKDIPYWRDRNRSALLSSKNQQAKMQELSEQSAKENYFIIGRQPTLWNLGIQAFIVRPVDGNAFVLSPLVVEPFNADFDGDTMHGCVAVGEAAQQEVNELMASTNNLYYPKSGELTVVLRHEILYGLYMASAIKTNEKQRTWTHEEILNMFVDEEGKQLYGIGEAVYWAVCKNKIAIYDKVPLLPNYTFDTSEDGYASAGICAIKYILRTQNSSYAMGVLPLTKYGGKVLKSKSVEDEDGKSRTVWVEVEAHDKTLDKKWFSELMTQHVVDDKNMFIDIINKAVRLGFAIAKIWPPSISTITDIDTSELVKEFNAKIVEREELLNLGFEIESAYSQFFDDELKKLDGKVYRLVLEKLGADIKDDDGKAKPVPTEASLSNGYLSMMLSGAKGNRSNIMQIFGIKGRMQKDDVNSFNTIIGNSLSKGLTGLESFITAYGARQGLADKVLSTAEPGYLSRKLEHAAATWCITTEDCGTTEGINWTYEDFLGHIDSTQLFDDPVVCHESVRMLVAKMFVGRYIVHNGHSIYIEDEDDFFNYTNNDTGDVGTNFFDTYIANIEKDEEGNNILNTWKEKPVYSDSGRMLSPGKVKALVVRSPITCENPCCQKCYGRDLASNVKVPKLGKPIGFIAAQSIGQPGTQLTMKNFQRGGVVSDANLTSSFQKIESYLDLTNLRQQKASKVTLAYDALSPREGKVVAVSDGTGRKKIQVLNEKDKDQVGAFNFYVNENVVLKDYVRVGDSFQAVQGDLNICEVYKYRGFEDAYKYFILILQRIFNAETYIDMKHFETIVASMISFVSLSDGIGTGIGQLLSLQEYRELVRTSKLAPIGHFTLTGLKALPKYRRDFFESMIMENMMTFVPRAFIMNPTDDMKNPKTRISFGQKINMGSAYKGFVEASSSEV